MNNHKKYLYGACFAYNFSEFTARTLLPISLNPL